MSELLVKEVAGAPSPASACARFLGAPYPLLLESASVADPHLGRYSFLTADPWLVLRSRGDRVESIAAGQSSHAVGDPFDALRAAVRAHSATHDAGLPPFQGGAAGYFAYDLCHRIERLPAPRFDELQLPEMCVGLYDWVLAWDHKDGKTFLMSTGTPGATARERRERAAARADFVLDRLAAAEPAIPRPHDGHGTSLAPTFPLPGVPRVRSTFAMADYLAAVERTREYIRGGDIFQANLSQRLDASLPEHPFVLYRRLRERNAAPFAAYFDFGAAAIASASPERFLQLRGNAVETRPIKGTRPRGLNPLHDSALQGALAASEKDRAENVMIVDLLRNDLSKVCEDGTVEVPELCRIERFATVHHLVSTVVGRLRPGLDAVDLLRAAFPGGSITGAPKVRAMEIIAELEPTRRDVYTGAIGYISFSGAMDTNIAIRTFVVKGGRAYFSVGGGIVSDSEPEREYIETLDKASGLLAALPETS